MRTLTRDLMITGGIVVILLVSLLLVRLTAAEPAPTTTTAAGVGDSALVTDPPTLELIPPTTTTATYASTPADPDSSSAPASLPQATLVLSSGAPVVPHPQRAPSSYQPAPTALPATPPTPPGAPDPGVFGDPARVAAAWLSALCWYDFRSAGPQENTRRAGVFGDTGMPAGQDPWTLDDHAWARITAGHLASGCTDITATVAPAPPDTTDQATVTLTAIQVLTVDATPYQAGPLTLTRTLRQDPGGRWLIGPPVIAN